MLSSIESFEWGLGIGPAGISEQQRRPLQEASEFDLQNGFTVPIHDGRGPMSAKLTTAAAPTIATADQRKMDGKGTRWIRATSAAMTGQRPTPILRPNSSLSEQWTPGKSWEETPFGHRGEGSPGFRTATNAEAKPPIDQFLALQLK